MADAQHKITTPSRSYAGRQYGVQFSRGEGVGSQEQAEYLRDTFDYEIEKVSAGDADELARAIDPTPRRGGAVTGQIVDPQDVAASPVPDTPDTPTAEHAKKAAQAAPAVTVEGEPADTEVDQLQRIIGIGPATALRIREVLVPTLDALADVEPEALASALKKQGAGGISAETVQGWKAQARAIIDAPRER